MCVSLQVSERASHWPGAAAQPQRTNRLSTLPRAGEGREGPLPPPRQPRAAGLRSPSCGEWRETPRAHARSHKSGFQQARGSTSEACGTWSRIKPKPRLLSSPGLIRLSGWGSARMPRANQNPSPFPTRPHPSLARLSHARGNSGRASSKKARCDLLSGARGRGGCPGLGYQLPAHRRG